MQNTKMYLIYIDESYDPMHFVYSALFVPAFEWNRVFHNISNWRKGLLQEHNIPMEYELHATDFVAGRGEPNENRDKDYRAQVFSSVFDMIESIDDIFIINGISSKTNHLKLFEHLLNRINRALEARNAFGVLVCDEGNEGNLISISRKMKKENHISSQFDKEKTINIPLERIIEDPLFKTSKSSYFIQLADFIAFSLLRNERPHKNTKNNVLNAFNKLDKVLLKDSTIKNTKGIVRI